MFSVMSRGRGGQHATPPPPRIACSRWRSRCTCSLDGPEIHAQPRRVMMKITATILGATLIAIMLLLIDNTPDGWSALWNMPEGIAILISAAIGLPTLAGAALFNGKLTRDRDAALRRQEAIAVAAAIRAELAQLPTRLDWDRLLFRRKAEQLRTTIGFQEGRPPVGRGHWHLDRGRRPPRHFCRHLASRPRAAQTRSQRPSSSAGSVAAR